MCFVAGCKVGYIRKAATYFREGRVLWDSASYFCQVCVSAAMFPPLSLWPYGSVILKLIRFDVKLICANFLLPGARWRECDEKEAGKKKRHSRVISVPFFNMCM